VKGPVTEIWGQRLLLLPERAVFWKTGRTLIVADAHLGKPAVLRAQGVPVPPGTARDDLKRLGRLLQGTGAERLLFLGDLFHAPLNPGGDRFRDRFARWRRSWSEVQLVLIAGNHDPAGDVVRSDFHIDVVAPEMAESPFLFSHRSVVNAQAYNLAGHVHPAVRLQGAARWSETLPCFLFGPRAGLLPAFGSFTGNYTVRPGPEDRIFAIADDEVVQV